MSLFLSRRGLLKSIFAGAALAVCRTYAPAALVKLTGAPRVATAGPEAAAAIGNGWAMRHCFGFDCIDEADRRVYVVSRVRMRDGTDAFLPQPYTDRALSEAVETERRLLRDQFAEYHAFKDADREKRERGAIDFGDPMFSFIRHDDALWENASRK